MGTLGGKRVEVLLGMVQRVKVPQKPELVAAYVAYVCEKIIQKNGDQYMKPDRKKFCEPQVQPGEPSLKGTFYHSKKDNEERKQQYAVDNAIEIVSGNAGGLVPVQSNRRDN